jgi:hypothetical protein
MSTTFVLTDTNSDLATIIGAVHNKKALAAAEGGTSLDITLSGGGTGKAVWYTEPSVPNLTQWPAGDYTLSADIDATGADITYTLELHRVNSAGTLVGALGTSGTLSGTGLKSFTKNIASPITTNAGDRLVGWLSATRAASHGNQTLTISVNGANDQLVGAWSPAGTTFFQTIAATAVGVSALSLLSTYLRTLAATAVGTAVLTSASVVGQALAATAAGVAALSVALVASVGIDATAVGAATLAKVTTFSRALAATAVGVASLTKKMYATLAATATGAVGFVKGMYKTLAVTATGVPSLGTALLSSVSMAATAVGSAALSAATIFAQAVSATTIGVAALVTEFIEGAGDGINAAYLFCLGAVYRARRR